MLAKLCGGCGGGVCCGEVMADLSFTPWVESDRKIADMPGGGGGEAHKNKKFGLDHLC